MNLHNEIYKDFIKEVVDKGNGLYLCWHLCEDSEGKVECPMSSFCPYLEKMLEGIYYDCDSIFIKKEE